MECPVGLAGQDIGVPVQVCAPVQVCHRSCCKLRSVGKVVVRHDLCKAELDIRGRICRVLCKDRRCIRPELCIDECDVLRDGHIRIRRERGPVIGVCPDHEGDRVLAVESEQGVHGFREYPPVDCWLEMKG